MTWAMLNRRGAMTTLGIRSPRAMRTGEIGQGADVVRHHNPLVGRRPRQPEQPVQARCSCCMRGAKPHIDG